MLLPFVASILTKFGQAANEGANLTKANVMARRIMKQLDLAEAKAKFSELVDAAARGDGIIIAKSGTPVAMLVPLDQAKHAPIKFGTLKGKVWIADNFDDPLPDNVLDEFEKGGGPLSLKSRK
jgi:prevent-host-death family protein